VSRVVYFDCASGASGDMMLGALVDLGLPLEALRAELAKLPLQGYALEARVVQRGGIRATKVDVVVPGRERRRHGHGHDHDHGGHDHGHGAGHSHRRLSDILGLIHGSGLDPGVKDRAAALFQRLAEAEAAVHGVGLEDVHFHEVGAVDSIVDVVGGVIGLAWLRAERFVCSPLNVGGGTVQTEHGRLPVPAPATARLLHGVPVYGSGEGERLTPTGALLLTGHAAGYGPLPPLRLEAVGYGAGTREVPDAPNVLRVIVGDEPARGEGDVVVVLEAELDDMVPQLYGPLMDRLLEAGALDAYYTPVQMKKGRPGTLVTALAPPERREAVEEALFSETTTLGVRRQEWQRSVLAREVVPVQTPYGTVGVKVGRRGGRVYNAQPEFEDCQRAASQGGVPLKEVWAAALAAYRGART